MDERIRANQVERGKKKHFRLFAWRLAGRTVRAAFWVLGPVLRLGCRPSREKEERFPLFPLFARPQGRPALAGVRRILAVRLDLLGDLALTLPALRSLRAAYPEAQITALVLPYTAPLLEGAPEVDGVLAYDVNQLRPSGRWADRRAYRDLWRLVRRLRAGRFDLAISFCGAWASALTLLSGAPHRVGYDEEALPGTLTLALPGRRYRVRRHEADYCLDLARAAGGLDLPSGRGLPILPAAVQHVEELHSSLMTHHSSLVALHLGASNGTAKRWTVEGWAELADRLIRAMSATVVFVGAAGDRALVEAVAALMAEQAIDLTGRTTIPELVALLARCQLVVGGDSGPLHLAVELGVPVVAIHGPSDPRLSGPYGGRALVVQRELPCSPCYDASAPAECPLGHLRCMRELSADEVFAAARQQLRIGVAAP